MAAKVRIIYYNTEETFRAVLEGQSDESELEVSDSSDIESDQLSSLQTTVILTQLLRYHKIGRQHTRLSLLLKFQMSLEEVLVEVEIAAKLGDEGSQLGLLAGERKISLRMYLLPRMAELADNSTKWRSTSHAYARHNVTSRSNILLTATLSRKPLHFSSPQLIG